MNDDHPLGGQALGEYAAFVRFLARVQLDPRLASKLDAEDIAQKTLLQAHIARDECRGENAQQVKAWLRQILLNVLANALRDLRTAKRDASRERSLDQALEDSSQRLDAILAGDQSTPSQRAQRNEEALQLEEALADLPDRQREAVVLKHYHGWPLAQISEHMKLSSSAVAGLLVRGMKALRKVLPEPG